MVDGGLIWCRRCFVVSCGIVKAWSKSKLVHMLRMARSVPQALDPFTASCSSFQMSPISLKPRDCKWFFHGVHNHILCLFWQTCCLEEVSEWPTQARMGRKCPAICFHQVCQGKDQSKTKEEENVGGNASVPVCPPGASWSSGSRRWWQRRRPSGLPCYTQTGVGPWRSWKTLTGDKWKPSDWGKRYGQRMKTKADQRNQVITKKISPLNRNLPS